VHVLGWPDGLRSRWADKISPEPMSGCWLWIGHMSGRGYGVAHLKKKRLGAHRAVYEELVGKIPSGLEVDHLCRNRICVNPQHLEPVTKRTNILRGVGMGARHARATACPRGHEYTTGNYYPRRGGGRNCRPCALEGSRAACLRLRGDKPPRWGRWSDRHR
jgi:hypothetical protein